MRDCSALAFSPIIPAVLPSLPQGALGAQSGWQNPCGGLGWRYDGHLIEIKGRGAVAYEPGHPRYAVCAWTWENWRCPMADAAARHGIPMSWILAIACVETGPWAEDPAEQAGKVSYAGARGIMQIMPTTAESLGYNPDDMFDAATNIDAGARLLAQLDRRLSGGLPALCGPYNSGRTCCDDPQCRPGCENPYLICTESDYPGAAIRYNNTAVRYFSMAPCSRMGTLLGFGLLAVGAGGFYKWWQRR